MNEKRIYCYNEIIEDERGRIVEQWDGEFPRDMYPDGLTAKQHVLNNIYEEYDTPEEAIKRIFKYKGKTMIVKIEERIYDDDDDFRVGSESEEIYSRDEYMDLLIEGAKQRGYV